MATKAAILGTLGAPQVTTVIAARSGGLLKLHEKRKLNKMVDYSAVLLGNSYYFHLSTCTLYIVHCTVYMQVKAEAYFKGWGLNKKQHYLAIGAMA